MAIDVLSARELAARLADPEWCEAPVTDPISPLTVVELSEPLATHLPATLPRFVVAIGAAAPGLDAVAADTDELDIMRDVCAAHWRAVITLAQLLRATATLDVDAALVAESLAYSTLLGGGDFRRWNSRRPRHVHRPSSAPVGVTYGDDGVTITLQRPDVHNAYDASTRDVLVDALRPLAALEHPPSIVLRGNGPSFCSGGDLAEFGTNDDMSAAHVVRVARSPGALLHRLAAVTTARVHGACIGAGVELPAFCGRVEAHRDTTFRLPEIGMGLVPGAGGTVGLPRRIGRQRTAALAVTGRCLDASQAAACGLVDAVL